MKQANWIFKLVTLAIVFLIPALAMAQPNCPDPNDPACVPIDGGLSLLIAAGVGYGVKKVRDSRKKQQAEQGL